MSITISDFRVWICPPFLTTGVILICMQHLHLNRLIIDDYLIYFEEFELFDLLTGECTAPIARIASL